MTVEIRGGRSAFVYLRVKMGLRSTRQYVGLTTDPVADLIYRADRLATATDQSNRESVEEEMAAYARLEPCLLLLSTKVTRCINRYRTKLRRRKHPQQNNSPRKQEIIVTAPTQPEQVSLTREQFDELMFRATGGSEEAVADLREALRANPACYHLLGDLARHVQVCLVELITKNAVVAREALNLKMDDLRESLLVAGDSPLARLVAEEVIASWLDLSFQRMSYAQEHPTEAIANRREQRLARAQERHLRAIRALNELQK